MDYKFGVEQGFNEFDYLSSIGRGRYYREIIRFMYLELQKREYLFSHEILIELKNMDTFFDDYTEEDCNRDLDYLCQKGNIIKYKNDYGQIKSLEELKKKRYRYQLTERCRLIESMIINSFNKVNTLSNVLDPNLLIRLSEELLRIKNEYSNIDDKELYSKWMSIMNAFKILRENYQGYIAELNSFEYEKLMDSKDFLNKKKKLKEYLEDFINVLIKESEKVAQILIELETSKMLKDLLLKVSQMEYERSKLVGEADFKVEEDKITNHYKSMRRWFLPDDEENESEAEILRKSTLNIVNKIIRLARMFIDKEKISFSRKESYRQIAKLILEENSIEESHLISSIIFGDFPWTHIKGNYVIPDEEVIKVEEARKLDFELSIKKIKRKNVASYMVKKKNDLKENAKFELEKQRKDEAELLEKYISIKENKKYIYLDSLPVISDKTKDLLINIIRRGLAKVRTEDRISLLNDKMYFEYNSAKYNSFNFKIYRPQDEEDRVLIESYDGKLNIPSFVIEMLEGDIL
jgi:uncharacterized protein (TIGR02677 family)